MLTSKERLLKCIRHEAIDRVPISTYELVGWNNEAWENNEPSYNIIMTEIRKSTDCIYMLDPEVRANPDPAIEQKEWDEGNSHLIKRIFHTATGELESLSRIDKGVHTTWTLKHLFSDISDIDKYLSIPYQSPEIDMTYFNSEKEKLGDKGLMMTTVNIPISLAASFFGMDTFLIYAITEPKIMKCFLDALFERQMHELRIMLRSDVKDIIFRICGPEYATPPYLSPDYFHYYVTPYLIEMCREIKEVGGIPRIHSHGKIGRVIDQFAMTCAEGIDPIEPPPDGDIGLADVKRLYGRQFCLFGNIELKELECSDRIRVDCLVKKAMEDAKEGSGFILMPTASPINVPLSTITGENYLQMIESALKYGRY